MSFTERTLREALELLDGMSVSGRENRRRMTLAETKILAVADGMAMAVKEKRNKEGGGDDPDRDGNSGV